MHTPKPNCTPRFLCNEYTPAVLIEYARHTSEAHRSQTVILSNDDIARRDQVDQLEIRAARAFGDCDRLRALALEMMRDDANQRDGDMMLSANSTPTVKL